MFKTEKTIKEICKDHGIELTPGEWAAFFGALEYDIKNEVQNYHDRMAKILEKK